MGGGFCRPGVEVVSAMRVLLGGVEDGKSLRYVVVVVVGV